MRVYIINLRHLINFGSDLILLFGSDSVYFFGFRFFFCKPYTKTGYKYMQRILKKRHMQRVKCKKEKNNLFFKFSSLYKFRVNKFVFLTDYKNLIILFFEIRFHTNLVKDFLKVTELL